MTLNSSNICDVPFVNYSLKSTNTQHQETMHCAKISMVYESEEYNYHDMQKDRKSMVFFMSDLLCGCSS
jgi:hypothetical protein